MGGIGGWLSAWLIMRMNDFLLNHSLMRLCYVLPLSPVLVFACYVRSLNHLRCLRCRLVKYYFLHSVMSHSVLSLGSCLIIMVPGVPVAVFVGVLGCVVLGWLHWTELIIFIPRFLLAAVLLRVACRQLKCRVAELQQKHYTLDGHRQENTCPGCGFRDEPEISHELWEPVYDVHRGRYMPGTLYSYASQEYECGFASNGKRADGPFESPRDLAEHMLDVHWDDGFHCPGCLRSLRRVRCGGGGGWGL